jgi:hypothetical protein
MRNPLVLWILECGSLSFPDPVFLFRVVRVSIVLWDVNFVLLLLVVGDYLESRLRPIFIKLRGFRGSGLPPTWFQMLKVCLRMRVPECRRILGEILLQGVYGIWTSNLLRGIDPVWGSFIYSDLIINVFLFRFWAIPLGFLSSLVVGSKSIIIFRWLCELPLLNGVSSKSSLNQLIASKAAFF